MIFLWLALALPPVWAADAASSKPASTEPASTEPAPLVVTNDAGPVKATVTVSPPEPRLGDVITLVLAVDADAGVSLEMPPFGDVLGRFSIVDFSPSEKQTDDGGTHAEQRYTLQAPMSGRQRLPAFRIAFTDTSGDPHELLTDEIPLRIGSVVDPGDDKLRAARGPMSTFVPPEVPPWAWWAGGATLVALVGAAFWLNRRRKRAPTPISAWEMAVRRLDSLAGQGAPEGAAVEPFYVELSDIVRHYLEDRYGLRAPESTTEEFLRDARRSGLLDPKQQGALVAFLAESDKVKFGRHTPGPDACRQALETARHFVSDTRPVEDLES